MKLFALLGAGVLALGTTVGAAPAEAQYYGHGRYHHHHQVYRRHHHPRFHGGYRHHAYYGPRRHFHR